MKLNRIILSLIAGNIFEWYDFSLYGYFAPYLAKLFFPIMHTQLALIATFIVFATGYIARPLGAIAFGYFGDKFGRKSALSFSILSIALSTCLIGLLPTYAAAGIFATLLLIICRMIQGATIGGEFTLSLTYLIEHAPANKKASRGSLAMLGTFCGLLLGSFTIALCEHYFSTAMLFSIGWRLPFLLSIALGMMGFFLRRHLPETAEFIALAQQQKIKHNPIAHTMQHHIKKLSIAIAMTCTGACSFSLWFVWLPSFLKINTHINTSDILFINSFNLCVIIVLIPFVGRLADKINHKMILLIGAVGSIVFTIPLLFVITQLTSQAFWFGQCMLAILASITYGVIPIILSDLFPTEIRCSGTSIAYNSANMIFGGTMPLIATLIVKNTNQLLRLGGIIEIAAILMLVLIPTLTHRR